MLSQSDTIIHPDGFDLGFIVIYITYLTFRIYGLKHDQAWAKDFSTDVLAIGKSNPHMRTENGITDPVIRGCWHVSKIGLRDAEQQPDDPFSEEHDGGIYQ